MLSEVQQRRRSAQRFGVSCLQASGRRFDPCRAHNRALSWIWWSAPSRLRPLTALGTSFPKATS